MNERPRRFWMSRRTWLGATALAALGLGAAGMATATPGWLGHARHGFGHFRGGSHASTRRTSASSVTGRCARRTPRTSR